MKNITNVIQNKRARAKADEELASADAAWMGEIATIFGGDNVDAVAATQEGQGEPGSRLRELYDAHIAARRAWNDTLDGHDPSA